MRWIVMAVAGFAAMAPMPSSAASFGALAGLVEVGREEAMTAEAVARRSSYRVRRSSYTRSPMRVSRAPHFTRHYRPRMAPPRTRW